MRSHFVRELTLVLQPLRDGVNALVAACGGDLDPFRL